MSFATGTEELQQVESFTWSEPRHWLKAEKRSVWSKGQPSPQRRMTAVLVLTHRFAPDYWDKPTLMWPTHTFKVDRVTLHRHKSISYSLGTEGMQKAWLGREVQCGDRIPLPPGMGSREGNFLLEMGSFGKLWAVFLSVPSPRIVVQAIWCLKFWNMTKSSSPLQILGRNSSPHRTRGVRPCHIVRDVIQSLVNAHSQTPHGTHCLKICALW